MDILKIFNRLKKEKKRYAVATVVDTEGSSPATIGQKMIIFYNGKTIGTVGGGAIEQKAIEDGLESLKRGISHIKKYDLNSAKSNKGVDTENVSMLCGGKTTIYYEINVPKIDLYIFGGGHIAQAMGKLIDKDKFNLIIIDNRKKFTDPAFHPHAVKTVHAKYNEFTANFDPAPNSFAVIVTHAHTNDYQVLYNLYKRKLPFQYIGMIGSKNKVTANLNKLYNDIGKIPLSNLYAPIGLKIGGDSPHEIAVSIIAEIQSIIYQKDTKHMKLDYEKIQ